MVGTVERVNESVKRSDELLDLGGRWKSSGSSRNVLSPDEGHELVLVQYAILCTSRREGAGNNLVADSTDGGVVLVIRLVSSNSLLHRLGLPTKRHLVAYYDHALRTSVVRGLRLARRRATL